MQCNGYIEGEIEGVKHKERKEGIRQMVNVVLAQMAS